MTRLQHDDAGFTLVELLLVVLIIAILAAISIPALGAQIQRGREAAVTQDLRSAALFMQVYRVENGGYDAVALAAFSPTTENVTITAPVATDDEFCLLGVHALSAEAQRTYTQAGLGDLGTDCAP
jgi:prepilin-type N-terminal cleavage/methylation domain-containing protein